MCKSPISVPTIRALNSASIRFSPFILSETIFSIEVVAFLISFGNLNAFIQIFAFMLTFVPLLVKKRPDRSQLSFADLKKGKHPLFSVAGAKNHVSRRLFNQ